MLLALGTFAFITPSTFAANADYLSVNTSADWMGEGGNNTNVNSDGAKGPNSLVVGKSSTYRQSTTIVGNALQDSGLGNNSGANGWNAFNGAFVSVFGADNKILAPQQNFPQNPEMGLTIMGAYNQVTAARGSVVAGFNNQVFGESSLGIGSNLTVNGTKGENVGIVMTSMLPPGGQPGATRPQWIYGDGHVGIGSGVAIGNQNYTVANATNDTDAIFNEYDNTIPVKAVAIGYDTRVMKTNGVAIGTGAIAASEGGVALGKDSYTKSSGTYNGEMHPLGYDPAAGTPYAISNQNASATWQSTLSELSIGKYNDNNGVTVRSRRIANVAAGVLDGDAVNVAQLKQITLKLKDDDTSPNTLALKLNNDTLQFKGDSNITTRVNSTDKSVTVSLKPTLTGITSITNGAVNPTGTPTTITIADTGLSLNNKSITGIVDKLDDNTAAVTSQALSNVANNAASALTNAATLAYVNEAGEKLVKIGDSFYTATSVQNLKKANDGNWYNATDVFADGSHKVGAQQQTAPQALDAEALKKVQLVAINPDGTLTKSISLANLSSGLGLANMNLPANAQSDASSTAIGDATTARKAIAGDAMDGSAGIYTISGANLHKAATIGDLQAVAKAGLTFTADEQGVEINRPLGTAIAIKAGTAITTNPDNSADYSTDNLATKIDTAANSITLQMKKNPSFAGITLTDATVGKPAQTLVLNDGKLALKEGTSTPQNFGINIKSGANTANINLNEALTVNGDSNITTTVDATKKDLTIALSPTLTGITSITNGANNAADATTVTITNDGFSLNNKNITGLTGQAITADSTAAVTGKQLFEALHGANVSITQATGQTMFTKADGTPLVKYNGNFYDKTSLDKKFKLANDGKYYAIANVDTNGNPTANSQPADLTTEATAEKVESSEVITSLVNANGSTKTAEVLGNLASGLGLANMNLPANAQSDASSTAIADATAARKAIAGDAMDGQGGIYTISGANLHKAATIGDLQAVAKAGLTFTADGATAQINRPLGTALNLATGTKLDAKDTAGYGYNNLASFVDIANNTIHFAMKSTPTFEGVSLSGTGTNPPLTLVNQDGKLALKEGNGAPKVLGLNITSGTEKAFIPLNGTLELTSPIPDITIKLNDTTTATNTTTSSTASTAGTQNPPTNPTVSPSTPPPTEASTQPFRAAQPTAISNTAKVTLLLADNAEVEYTENYTMKDNTVVNKGYLDTELKPLKALQNVGNELLDMKKEVQATNNNVATLTKQIHSVANDIASVSDESRAGIAAAIATANIPQVLQGKNRNAFGIGVGSYRSGSALAMGLSGTNRKGTVIWKLTSSLDSNSNMSFGAGLGFTYGPTRKFIPGFDIASYNELLQQQEAEIASLKAQNQEQIAENMRQSTEIKRQADEIALLKSQVNKLLVAMNK